MDSVLAQYCFASAFFLLSLYYVLFISCVFHFYFLSLGKPRKTEQEQIYSDLVPIKQGKVLMPKWLATVTTVYYWVSHSKTKPKSAKLSYLVFMKHGSKQSVHIKMVRNHQASKISCMKVSQV